MFKRILVLAVILILGIACSSSDDDINDNDSSLAFDRALVLTNWSDNIIAPIYQDLNTKLADLVEKKDDFVAEPNQDNLDGFRSSWFTAYKVWQYAEMFNVGRAEEINYSFQMNIYPANILDIQNNIESESYDLANVNNNDAVGFPALDYLLYGLADTDVAILEFYTSNDDAPKYLAYASDVTNQMKSLTQDVASSWANYRTEFVNGVNNTATGSVNIMVNDFVFYYEKGLRANKVGTPAGNFSANPFPDKVEAYYRGDISKELLTEALKAVKDFFNGNAYNASTTDDSLVAYLDYLNTIKNGEDLSFLINNKFDEAQSVINSLDDNFAEQITTNNTKMTEAYDALQRVVVLIKVDMLQALNVSIDYVDSDGD